MSGALQSHWARLTPVSLSLLPLALLFAGVVYLRRVAYRRGWFASFAVGAPVIVVGNITAGGNGKTPMVLWLVDWLRARGLRPGVVSRGYGGSARGCVEVTRDSRADSVGDEPLLIHRKCRVPVVVGRDRVAAARLLRARHPEVNVLVCDDGLQHYRLRRDLEIAVLDAGKGLGNGLPLPAGPLREPASRLETVDARLCIERGQPSTAALPDPCHRAQARFGPAAYAVDQSVRKMGLATLLAEPFLAVSGIGNPQGFFSMLRRAGGRFEQKIFPDHHQFSESDLPSGRRIVMTEKDAVKCQAFAQSDWWAVELEMQPDAAFVAFLEVKTRHFFQEAACP